MKNELSPEALALIDAVLESRNWTNPQAQDDFDAKEQRKQARLARNRIKDRARWPGGRKARKPRRPENGQLAPHAKMATPKSSH